MANGVTLIAGHNIIMDSTYADEKFARGEITNKQIITTQKDWDAVEQGKVGRLEEQSPVSAWSGVTEQPKEELTDAQIAAEEQAREEAQSYLVDGTVDWTKVANDTEPVDITLTPPKETHDPNDRPNVIVGSQAEFEEFQEYLAWKRMKQSQGEK